MLLFSITFACVSVISTIFAFLKNKEGLGIFLLGLSIFGNLIVFIAFGLTTTVRTETKQVNCKVVRTNRVVLVDDGEKVWEFDKYEDYKSINDSSKFFHTYHYNMYGSRFSTELNIKSITNK